MFSPKNPEENVLLNYYVTYKGFKKLLERDIMNNDFIFINDEDFILEEEIFLDKDQNKGDILKAKVDIENGKVLPYYGFVTNKKKHLDTQLGRMKYGKYFIYLRENNKSHAFFISHSHFNNGRFIFAKYKNNFIIVYQLIKMILKDEELTSDYQWYDDLGNVYSLCLCQELKYCFFFIENEHNLIMKYFFNNLKLCYYYFTVKIEIDYYNNLNLLNIFDCTDKYNVYIKYIELNKNLEETKTKLNRNITKEDLIIGNILHILNFSLKIEDMEYFIYFNINNDIENYQKVEKCLCEIIKNENLKNFVKNKLKLL
jgi:hypothetical protein